MNKKLESQIAWYHIPGNLEVLPKHEAKLQRHLTLAYQQLGGTKSNPVKALVEIYKAQDLATKMRPLPKEFAKTNQLIEDAAIKSLEQSDQTGGNPLYIGLGIGGGVLVIGAALAVWLYRRRRQQRGPQMPSSVYGHVPMPQRRPPMTTYAPMPGDSSAPPSNYAKAFVERDVSTYGAAAKQYVDQNPALHPDLTDVDMDTSP